MISQTAEYALRAVVALGARPDQPLTTQQIANATKVPAGYLSKVLQALGKAGFVEARRGLHGGYVLSKPLDELTVFDVVNAVEPLKRIEHCPLRLAAHTVHLCALHRRLDDAFALTAAVFKETTIGALLAEPNPSQPLCDLTPEPGGLLASNALKVNPEPNREAV